MMDRGVVDTLRSALVGERCLTSRLVHGYPFLEFGDHRSIRTQSRWLLRPSDEAIAPIAVEYLEGLTLTGLDVFGDLSDLRLTFGSFVFETHPEGDDLHYETWIAHLGPSRVAGAGPGSAWFSSL